MIKIASCCVTVLACAALIAYAIALPRYQVSQHGDGFLVNDRFSNEIFYCTGTLNPAPTRAYVCLRIDPAHSAIVEAPKR